jgi:hypothetical protein
LAMFSESDFKAFEEKVISYAREIYRENMRQAEEEFKAEEKRIRNEAERKLKTLRKGLTIDGERKEKEGKRRIEAEFRHEVQERTRSKIREIKSLCLKLLEENEEAIFKAFISSVLKKYKTGTFIINERYRPYFKDTSFRIGNVSYAIFEKDRLQVELSVDEFIQSAIRNFLKAVEDI